MSTAALIVAAGRGTRFGSEIPKQYVPIAGVCAFRRSVERFLAQDYIDTVQPVIHADDQAMFDRAMAGLCDTRLQAPVVGGETRAASVRRGLAALERGAPTRVLVHDAARPFVSDEIIWAVCAALDAADGAFAALPIVDALWHVDGAEATAPVPRADLWRAQTPQGFRFGPLLQAHQQARADAADDVEIARGAGLRVTVVRGTGDNFKITSPEDLVRAEQVAARL